MKSDDISDIRNRNSVTGNDRLGRLADGDVGRLLWNYSLPAVVGMLVMSLYNVIDRIFIGQGVGPDAIAGLAVTFPVMNLSAALGVLIGAGASARVSILLGSGDRRGADMVLGNALTLILVNAAVYLSLFAWLIDPILRAFGASDVTLPYARDFMLYLLPGMLMMNVSFSFNNVMRASGYPGRAMVTMFIGAGCNLVLAPIFIFLLGMGIKGAAIATDISMTISAFFVMIHFFRPDVTLRFHRGTFGLQWRTVLAIVSIGAAPGLVNAAQCVINVILNRALYLHGGDHAIAAAGIFVTYTSLLTMVMLGICQGMQPIVGYNYGSGRYDRLWRAYILAVGASTLLSVAGGVFGAVFGSSIARAFTTDSDLIATTANAFRKVLLCFWAVGFQIVSTTFFQSIGKAGRSIILSLCRQVIFLIPLLLTLPSVFGLNGIWYAFPSSDALATLVTAILIAVEFTRMRRRVTCAPSVNYNP